VLVLSAVPALWLVVAVLFLGDISARFNRAMTLAFALRRDSGWAMGGLHTRPRVAGQDDGCRAG
jgi:glycerol uptake facilitator-like aquaporin